MIFHHQSLVQLCSYFCMNSARTHARTHTNIDQHMEAVVELNKSVLWIIAFVYWRMYMTEGLKRHGTIKFLSQ